MAHRYPTALPIAYVALRILVVVNLLAGLGIALLLVFVAPRADWITMGLKLAPSPETGRLIWGLRAVAVLGLAAVPMNHVALSRLAQMAETVRRGDAFIAANVYRLYVIAWALLGLQVLSLIIGGIGAAISTAANPVHLSAGFSPAGWLAVLLTFVLARIFAEGVWMREDLAGTV